MTIQHVSLGFAALSDSDLDAIVENIIASMTNNAAFLTPPITMTVLQTELDAFTAAMAASAQGGKQATVLKNESRASLLAMLRTLASYVQLQSNNDLGMLLSSGFQATSLNRTQTPLPQPAIEAVLNQASTQLVLRVTPLDNAKAYEVHYGSTPGVWLNGVTSTKARRIVVPGLTPGTTYSLQVRAVGGSTGYSPWSDAVSHMAT